MRSFSWYGSAVPLPGPNVAEQHVNHVPTEHIGQDVFADRFQRAVARPRTALRCVGREQAWESRSRSDWKKTANGEPLAVGKWRRGESNPRPEAVGGRVYMRSLVFCSRCQVSHGQDPW